MEWHVFLTANRQQSTSEVQSARRLTVVAGEGGGGSAAGGTRVPLSAVPLSAAQQGAAADQREALLRSLVDRIRENDLAAFDQLYLLTRDEAARTLFHLVGRRAEIEDLLQETYLRLLSAAKTYRGEAKFRTFLYRVCANVALMHLRWKRRRPEDVMAEIPEPEPAPSSSGPEGEASRHEAAKFVEAALEGLTAKKRVVFVYHELCGMGPEEIAAIVGTSPNTVRSRLHHARLEFQEAMQKLLKAPRGNEMGGADGVR